MDETQQFNFVDLANKNLSKTLFILHAGLRGLCFSKNKVDRLNANLSGLSLLSWQQDKVLIFHSPRIVVKYKCDLGLGH